MILFDGEIERQRGIGNIVIEPFNPDHLGPNSYDVTLGPEIVCYRRPWWSYLPFTKWSLDARKSNPVFKKTINEDGILLKPGRLYLAHTNEVAGTTDKFVPHITGRSSVGRLGMAVHVTAGFGDVGFRRQWTLEITVVHPLRVYPGDRIAQVYFLQGVGWLKKAYQGRYAKQAGATPSRFHEG